MNPSSFLSGITEDGHKSNENVDGVKINTDGSVNWVISLLSLGIVNDFLGVVQNKSTEECESTVQPDISESFGTWI